MKSNWTQLTTGWYANQAHHPKLSPSGEGHITGTTAQKASVAKRIAIAAALLASVVAAPFAFSVAHKVYTYSDFNAQRQAKACLERTDESFQVAVAHYTGRYFKTNQHDEQGWTEVQVVRIPPSGVGQRFELVCIGERNPFIKQVQ